MVKRELGYVGELLLKTHTLTFNLHDIILLFTFIQSLLFVIFFVSQKHNNDGLRVFIAFMLAISLGALNFFITYYERSYNFIYTHLSTEFTCITPLVFYFPGLLLFEFVKTVTYGKFAFSKFQLLPLLVFVLVYLWHPVTLYQGEWARLFWRDHVFIATIGFALSAVYGVLAVLHLRKYAVQLQQLTADINTVSYAWLRVLTYGFTIIWILEVAAPFLYHLMNWILHNLTVHFKNIVQMALVSYVIYSNLVHSKTIQNIPMVPFANHCESPQTQLRDAARLRAAMDEKKYYRHHNLTIEYLANHVQMSERELSSLINNHFNKNFYEFVNEYRIDEAKVLLRNPNHKKKSIQIIYEEVGFHSKSSFNTLFKKYAGVTPSEYRKQHSH